MTDKQEYFNNDPIIKTIRGIKFDILSGEQIRAMSSMKGTHGIEIPELYDKQEPKLGGLLDPRMGATTFSTCATCNFETKYCVGHPSHIDLAEPVFNILFVPYVKGILDCVCLNCSNILVDKNTDKFKQILKIKNNKNRFLKIREMASKTKICMKPNQECGTTVTKIMVEIKKNTSDIEIYSVFDSIDDDKKTEKRQKFELKPEIVANILDNISDEDCKILGMDTQRSRPSSMIHKVFHVPPLPVRPSMRGFFNGGTSSEDSLTGKLTEIVRANIRMNKNKETNTDNSLKHSKHYSHFLQLQTALYYNPDLIQNPKNDAKGNQFKSITERLKGKHGRIRKNIMGKRGDHNARTVITSDASIGADCVGVPVRIAMTITYPERVTKNNIERLTELVKNGTDKYPGANNVYISDSENARPIYLKYKKEELVLQIGDIVERHLQDDDIVLLNRQPSLHKQSMMGHKIKVINDPSLLTFRLSPAVTTPYNAD